MLGIKPKTFCRTTEEELEVTHPLAAQQHPSSRGTAAS